ncbi:MULTISPECIES: phage virion morphogenesis protein [Serratia]|uniref:phage virion morphogenesis protein n=1 Tax=Serratia TaxID=613 RepID=UPI00065FAE29|nr:phage virion morphogenesis protein [Serratia sp. 506_PEND]
MIEIKVDVADLQRRMAHMLDWLAHREPLMRDVAAQLHEAVNENFAQQGRPAWLGLKRIEWKGVNDKHKILQLSGRLISSIVERSDNDSATVGTNVEYAAIHQFGGDIKKAERQHSLYFKRNKNTGALKMSKKRYADARIDATIGAHTFTMPARPFLALTDSDEEKIATTVSEYLFKSLL